MDHFSTLDFLEAQGITNQMVEDYLRRRGWENTRGSLWRAPPRGAPRGAPRVLDPYDPDSPVIPPPPEEPFHVQLYVLFHITGGEIEGIARREGRLVQSLLADINPRMRPGLPSEEVRCLHAGLWVVKAPYRTFPTLARFVLEEGTWALQWWGEERAMSFVANFGEIDESWSFWPADENGNKIFWYERDDKML